MVMTMANDTECWSICTDHGLRANTWITKAPFSVQILAL